MAYKIRPIRQNDTLCLPLDQKIAELLEINEETELTLRTDGKALIFENDSAIVPPPLPNESERSSKLPIEEEYLRYWALAAEEGMREKFMGSLRPILRARLNYEYSEVICEKEAIKLCYRFYKAKEKGENIEGPFIPDWNVLRNRSDN